MHPAAPSGSAARWRPALLLAAAILVAYANALLDGAFQFDDYNVIVDNPRVHSWQAWWDDVGRGIRPLLKLSYTLDWTSGWGVTAFHLSNLLIHFINALLVLHLTQRHAAGQARLQPQAANIALFTALLFALHPIHSEAITYVSGRSAALMTTFYLGGLLAYAAGRCNDDRRLLHGLVPLCFLLALGVKETAVTFPLGLLAWELCSGGRPGQALRRQWSSWLLLVAAALYFIGNPAYLAHLERSATLNSPAGNLANAALGLAWLLRQWLAPFWLDIDPDLPLLRDFSAAAALPLLLLLALTATMGISLRRRPWLAFALAWLLIQLVSLYLVLPRLDVANERQMYLAGWPLAMLLAVELALRLRARPRLLKAVAAALLLLAGGLTIARNRDYRSEIALWEATVRVSPDKARAHNNLGYAYALAGRRDEARAEYRRALQLDPQDIKARHNLARLEVDAGAAARPSP